MRFLRYLPDLTVGAVSLCCLAYWGWHWLHAVKSRSRRAALGALILVVAILLTAGVVLRSARVAAMIPHQGATWIRGAAMMAAFLLIPGTGLALLLFRVRVRAEAHDEPREEHMDEGRRRFLKRATVGAAALPGAALGYGVFLERRQFEVREVEAAFAGLPKGLDGLRIVQISDIHLSPFLSRSDLAYAVSLANETKAHIALVTGDLISTPRDPLDDCLAELAKLKADAGVFGCMGNHEQYSGAMDYTERNARRMGIEFLRGSRSLLRLPGGWLNLAGVDYQEFRRPYLVGAEKLVDPTAGINILMSHNPDVFPVAAQKGFQFTIGGHTHGGQITVEILRQHANVARFFTPYVDGLYQERNSAVYVSRGIGTIGLPARIGVPPEVSLIRLCAT